MKINYGSLAGNEASYFTFANVDGLRPTPDRVRRRYLIGS